MHAEWSFYYLLESHCCKVSKVGITTKYPLHCSPFRVEILVILTLLIADLFRKEPCRARVAELTLQRRIGLQLLLDSPLFKHARTTTQQVGLLENKIFITACHYLEVNHSENFDVQLLFLIDSPLNICPIYIKITWALATLSKKMYKTFGVNRTNSRELSIGNKSCTSRFLAWFTSSFPQKCRAFSF